MVRFGERKPTMSAPSKTAWRPQKVGWSGLCPLPLRRMTGRGRTGRTTYHERGGGPKPFLGSFMVCFPSFVFSPLFCRFLKQIDSDRSIEDRSID